MQRITEVAEDNTARASPALVSRDHGETHRSSLVLGKRLVVFFFMGQLEVVKPFGTFYKRRRDPYYVKDS